MPVINMAANAMYKVKPFYGDSDVVQDYPTSIYKMKNIHRGSDEDLVIDDPALLELINCQELVLKELGRLTDEVYQIGVDIGVNKASKSDATKIITEKKPSCLPEAAPCNIVIKASPDDPPLSVSLLCQFAQQHGLDCSLKSHVHSSWARQIPNELCELFDTSCSKNSRVCLRFIWKSDILAPNLMVSVATQSLILGEANILRYLARTFLPDLYSNYNPLQITTIDDWLNSAINLTSPKDVKIFIQNLNTHLGKHNWLSGNAASIADIYCSVALLKHGGQFPKNVLKWMTQCRKEFPGFDQVEKLCK